LQGIAGHLTERLDFFVIKPISLVSVCFDDAGDELSLKLVHAINELFFFSMKNSVFRIKIDDHGQIFMPDVPDT
jgi:hypothetical protein